jgi:hypothetical protein
LRTKALLKERAEDTMKLGLRQMVKQGLITKDEARRIIWNNEPEATATNNRFLAWLDRRRKVKAVPKPQPEAYEPDPIMDKIQGECNGAINDHGECRKCGLTDGV